MGSFEKLGILVIVVIIVMILAVAIHQWGGTGSEVAGEVGGIARAFVPGSIDPAPLERDPTSGIAMESPPLGAGQGNTGGAAWPDGIPRSYTVQKDDVLWKLVVQTWKLKDSFIRAIEASNPKMNVAKLMPGETIAIPDPAAYREGAGAKASGTSPPGGATASYEVRANDSFESIAKKLLGSASRWREIQVLNPGIKPRALQQGQVIVVPVK